MADGPAKPVIFISYSHKDEPERAPEGNIHWLTDLQSYLAPAANGTFELWSDEELEGGADWEKGIKEKLAVCDICVLLVSRHSLGSKYVIEVEIETIRERQRRGHDVQIYPIVLSPFPESAAAASLLALNLRPRLDKPLSGFSRHERGVEISKIVEEIVALLKKKTAAIVAGTPDRPKPPGYVHITGLPETAYERLVGRDDELKRLDDAWADRKTNIISLIAEGGAGKSALVNEWLKRLQADNYRGAEAVLGWSFYSQGSKERATAADEFLSWSLDKLDIKLDTTSATAKGEGIAEALMQRQVLLVLDGVEPLQHALDTQFGQLKDQGLRALLRRFASTPPSAPHGLIVLTSRLSVADIARWKDSSAPVEPVDKLSDQAGVALLRDNGVWGTDKELKAASGDFGGHPLALVLLASLLKETQTGDARRRDHIRGLLADADDVGHDHARRIMESFEREWLAGRPLFQLVMRVIGLFDRPVDASVIQALLQEPLILGILARIRDADWNRAVSRLRDVKLIAPADRERITTLDAHPLVREWFGERFRHSNETGWRIAHRCVYEHLRDGTREGKAPTLEDLAPLYQAIRHGVFAGIEAETLHDIYIDRICRRGVEGNLEYYSVHRLGAISSELAAISWFFDPPYMNITPNLNMEDQLFVERQAANCLRAQGRLTEVLPFQYEQLKRLQSTANQEQTSLRSTRRFTRPAINLVFAELLVGHIAKASELVEHAVELTKPFVERPTVRGQIAALFAMHANVLTALGQRDAAKLMHAEREQFIKERRPRSFINTYGSCDLLLDAGDYIVAGEHAKEALARVNSLIDNGLYTLILGRVHFALALKNVTGEKSPVEANENTTVSSTHLDCSIDSLRKSGQNDHLPRGLLARAAFRRSIGDWGGVARDLDEVEEIAEPGPMRLFLCDMALERVRLAFAQIEAFGSLNGTLEKDNPPKPVVPSADEIATLKSEAERQLKMAADYIETCGYHRRDEELAELQAVLRSERKFADLPPRV
jgi:hypothetical protein